MARRPSEGGEDVDLTWLGHSCFRLRGRGAAVVTDPYPPSLGTRLRLEADVVTVSHHHASHDHVQVVGEAFVIDPYPPRLGPPPRLEADVVTVSHPHPSHDHVQVVREAFVIDTPGEFEHA